MTEIKVILKRRLSVGGGYFIEHPCVIKGLNGVIADKVDPNMTIGELFAAIYNAKQEVANGTLAA